MRAAFKAAAVSFSILVLGGAAAAAAKMLPSAAVLLACDGKLTVSSPAFRAGADIPPENTQYRGNQFPGLRWSKGPAGTQSYAIVMQDRDEFYQGGAAIHWTLFNIPPDKVVLEPKMTGIPTGSVPGPNYEGKGQLYLGPMTPAGPRHHYDFQVFALDRDLLVDSQIDFPGLLDAMHGHVLACGDLIGFGKFIEAVK